MSLGLVSGRVKVVAYDVAWPRLFADEASRIGAFLDGLPLALEHTGSTSVLGLAAKPILDILGGHPLEADLSAYITAIERAGYVYRGEQGIPGRHFFRRGEPRSHHLHLALHDGGFWREHLAFRDALRGDARLREEYAALKLALAERHPFDRESYINGKTWFVRNVVTRTSA